MNPPALTVSEIIRQEIANAGPISFARFMELALYFPKSGYYERIAQPIGRQGDYFTSVSVGNVFGELLAFQFVQWLNDLSLTHPVNSRCSIQIIEAGAHDGQLAFDILSWISQFHPAYRDRLQYFILEPSTQREQWQRTKLQPFTDCTAWRRDWSEISDVIGVIFSNELLDAFPVHRFGWDAPKRQWFEWGVDWQSESFRWVQLSTVPPPELIPNVPFELVEYLPHGYIAERSPRTENWWVEAVDALKFGKVLTIDYGFGSGEAFRPERLQGTARAYRQHRVSTDVLADPGEQDITAHVDFGALQMLGAKHGLSTERFCPQTDFLVDIAEQTWRPEARFNDWTQDRRRQFQTLIHPQHLGRPFRVLVQHRTNPN